MAQLLCPLGLTHLGNGPRLTEVWPSSRLWAYPTHLPGEAICLPGYKTRRRRKRLFYIWSIFSRGRALLRLNGAGEKQKVEKRYVNRKHKRHIGPGDQSLGGAKCAI